MTTARVTAWPQRKFRAPVATSLELGELNATLARLSAATPCAEHPAPLWLSDDEDERAAAAQLCAPCPVLAACRAAGEHEHFGVWGGADRTPKPRPRGRRRRASTESKSGGATASALVSVQSCPIGHNFGHNGARKSPKPPENHLVKEGAQK